MNKSDRSQLRAGLLILGSIVLVMAVVVAIKGARTFIDPKVVRSVAFDLAFDVGGLRIGDDVRVGGFKVGVVRDIHPVDLESQHPYNVITFDIPRRYPLKQDARIAIQTTVTGASVLNIDSLGRGELLPDDKMLVGQPSALSTLFTSLGTAGPAVQNLLADLRGTTIPKVNTALDTANSALARGGEAAANVRDLLGDTKLDFRGTIANLNTISGSVKDKAPGILDHLDNGLKKISDTLDNAKSALEDIKAAAAQTRDITASARSLIVGNRGKLESMIASLKTTGDNLKGASAEVRRSPWRLLYKPHPGEIENLTLFDAARQFSDGATQINDASLALRDAMNNPNVDKEQVRKLMEKLDGSFAAFHEVEQKLWTAVKE